MKLTEAQLTSITELRYAGKTYKEIAIEVNCADWQAKEYCLRHDIIPKMKKEQEERAKELGRYYWQHELRMAREEIKANKFPPFGKDRKLEW